MNIPILSITIGPRQRLELGDLTELADSIRDNGQIHAILLRDLGNSQYELIAGRRRLAATMQLGRTEIRGEHLSPEQVAKYDSLDENGRHTFLQELEWEEDYRRKDRTWQEKCIAFANIYRLKKRQSLMAGDSWTYQNMADWAGVTKGAIDYNIDIADALTAQPRDDEAWACSGPLAVLELFRQRREREAFIELEKRRQAILAITPITATPTQSPVQSLASTPAARILSVIEEFGNVTEEPSNKSNERKVFTSEPTMQGRLSLKNRVQNYNSAFPLWKQTLSYNSNPEDRSETFIFGHWHVGGGNISDLYGSYQVEYLKRIETLFPDCKSVVHLFVGSLPPSPNYTRVGLAQEGHSKPDFECDAHELSSKLPFKPDLIYADPPYSVEDSEHYSTGMVNRPKVVSECANVLQPGGFLVWLDQALPVFSNDELRLVGVISYIRSTGNRFRCVCIFQKPL